MIKSTPKQTQNIIVALMNYTVDSKDPMFNKFQFASIYMDEFIIQSIKCKKQLYTLSPITLIEADYMYNQTNDNKPGFEYIKLDSISFLEDKPIFENITTINGKGGITCHSDFFTFNMEWCYPDCEYPMIIYKSARFGYERISNLLKS